MRLYDIDYRCYHNISEADRELYKDIEEREISDCKSQGFGKKNYYPEYPESIKHYKSLFPNNHINLHDVKKNTDIQKVNRMFEGLIHRGDTNEQEILRFINHEQKAFYIVGAILTAAGFRFGHHECYIFPEFRLGDDYKADYLIIGKGSGGYEFVFVEFETPSGRVTLKDGHKGQGMRFGENQANDWKRWVDSKFNLLQNFFKKEMNQQRELSKEFYSFDNTRMHYVVVTGTRDDYSVTTYAERRRLEQETKILHLHYDNLINATDGLKERNTF